MNKFTYKVEINAPKERVWDMMLSDNTYREWTSAFMEGSYFVGSWDKGSKILFLADDQGKPSGMVSKIIENIPFEYVSIEHVGEVVNGKEDTESDAIKKWAGALENYIFKEESGVTDLTVELLGNWDTELMTKEMLDEMWEKSLQKLKEICEK